MIDIATCPNSAAFFSRKIDLLHRLRAMICQHFPHRRPRDDGGLLLANPDFTELLCNRFSLTIEPMPLNRFGHGCCLETNGCLKNNRRLFKHWFMPSFQPLEGIALEVDVLQIFRQPSQAHLVYARRCAGEQVFDFSHGDKLIQRTEYPPVMVELRAESFVASGRAQFCEGYDFAFGFVWSSGVGGGGRDVFRLCKWKYMMPIYSVSSVCR